MNMNLSDVITDKLHTPWPWTAEVDPRTYCPSLQVSPPLKTEGLLSVLEPAAVKAHEKQYRALLARRNEAAEEAAKHDLDGILAQIDHIGRADNRRKLELLQRIQFVDCDKHEAAMTALRQADTGAADLACKIIGDTVPAHLAGFLADMEQQEARLLKFGVPFSTADKDQKQNDIQVWQLHSDPVAGRIFFELWSLEFFWSEEFYRPRWSREGMQWDFLRNLFPPAK
jgi:hypothetical protein